MATVYSTGYNQDNATPPVNHPPDEGGGRVRVYYDTYLQGAEDGNIGDVITMKNLPAGARILSGTMAFGTGNTNETLACGITGTATKFVGATAAETAGTVVLDDHLVAGYKTTAEVAVIVTNATAAIKAAQRVTVILFYVID
jgi:hypothetical protein